MLAPTAASGTARTRPTAAAMRAMGASVERIGDRLRVLLRAAAACTPAKFVNLDMEEYRDLALTLETFQKVLDEPEFRSFSAGIVLQAYLPDALSAMMRLQEWARARRERGGAGIKVRLVKGANLPMEHVEASLHDWPVATLPTKQDTDANYKRVLDYALRPEHTTNVRIGVAGHNLFDIAYAWALAGRRGVRDRVEFEMLLGMAEAQAEAVRRTVGGLLLSVIGHFRTAGGAEPDELAALKAKTGLRTVPQIFINDQLIGGFTDMQKLDQEGKLDALLQSS